MDVLLFSSPLTLETLWWTSFIEAVYAGLRLIVAINACGVGVC